MHNILIETVSVKSMITIAITYCQELSNQRIGDDNFNNIYNIYMYIVYMLMQGSMQP